MKSNMCSDMDLPTAVCCNGTESSDEVHSVENGFDYFDESLSPSASSSSDPDYPEANGFPGGDNAYVSISEDEAQNDSVVLNLYAVASTSSAFVQVNGYQAEATGFVDNPNTNEVGPKKHKRDESSDFEEENRSNSEAEEQASKRARKDEAEQKELDKWWKKEIQKPVNWKKLMIMRYAKDEQTS